MRSIVVALLLSCVSIAFSKEKEKLYLDPIDVKVPHLRSDSSVKIDYDIAYVRAPRAGDKVHKRFFTDFSSPVTMEAGADLMLLHPDGSEELLVKGGDGAITDPVVSLDGQWIFYTHIHNLIKASQWNPPKQGADIYKINVKSRKIVKLTNQRFTPNTGAAHWSSDYRKPEPGKSHFEYGVYNMGACPLPGGRVAFTSNRDGFRPAKGYPAICLQLFVMDDSDTDIDETSLPPNLEKIGHLNLAGALHPVLLRDGRIMYSTLESQGARGDILWGIWTINPDGTEWNPLVSAFDPGGAPNGFHFQTQLSNGDIVFEEYYNQNNSGFGALMKIVDVNFPAPSKFGISGGSGGQFGLMGNGRTVPGAVEFQRPSFGYGGGGGIIGSSTNYPSFAPARMDSTVGWRFGRHDNGKPRTYKMPFMPLHSLCITPFSMGFEGPADRSIRGDKNSPSVGKFTHPSGAPDNHLLTCYSPGPVNHQYTFLPQLDGGIYIIKKGETIESPSEMRLIKNDPNYNECWPRAVVPYERIYGSQPREVSRSRPVSRLHKQLPEGSPFGYVGTSSFYKRESYPNGDIKDGVTATYVGKGDPWKGLDAFTSHGNGMPLNWHNQGADAGLYSNDDIHSVRILTMEPTTDRKGANAGRRYHNHAGERLRILGEIPLRKFENGKQSVDPDGNPDTSFLAKIPADVGFTFQTLDKRGMVLNAAQTWHQLRPGEVRVNCGGCHAHSQVGTRFDQTAAASDKYRIWDLTIDTPIGTDKATRASDRKWDVNDSTGLRHLKNGPLNVEYWRDIKPILNRSCISCHSGRDPASVIAGNLNLDADDELVQADQYGKFPATYYRLALDERAKFGIKPAGWDSWGYPNASRYVRKFQSRRSLLVWKIYGERLDGFSNDDHPSETKPGNGKLQHHGEEIDLARNKSKADLDFVGSRMPPESAVKAGGKPLTDEDRRTIVRWIDLGCPIDLDYDPKNPAKPGFGWMLDDQRPTLSVKVHPERIAIGMLDYGTGLDMSKFTVTADVAIDGIAAGQNLADKFTTTSQGVWTWKPSGPLPKGKLTVSIADKQGNVARIERHR